MSKNWAITVGVNNYSYLQPLSHAVRDADMLCDLFEQELQFGKVYHFTDTSKPITPDHGKPLNSIPTFTNLKRFLDVRFQEPFLGDGDNLWFFFAGHGAREGDHDYLIPIDGYRSNLADTAIPVRYLSDRLRHSGADNIILLMDACRSSERSRSGTGLGMETQQGVITIYACSPEEFSYEINDLKQGAFTHVLLESLRLQGQENCATVERLYDRLRLMVPQLTMRHRRATQTPYGVVEPMSKKHLILLPQLATSTDVVKLKELALKAEIRHDWQEAKQLWTRVLAAPSIDSEVRADAISGIGRVSRGETQPAEIPTARNSKSATIDRQTSLTSAQTDIDSSTSLRIQDFKEPEALPVGALASDRNIDYSKLSNLLQKQQWKQANQETERLMLQAARRRREGWLSHKAINQFPETDLQTLDLLWRHYSHNHFGFAVQKKIFATTGHKAPAFITKVAWPSNAGLRGGAFLSEIPCELQFTVAAPAGHLPFVFGGEHNWIFERLQTGNDETWISTANPQAATNTTDTQSAL